MNRAERLTAHHVGDIWMPNPEAHLQSVRDAAHFNWTIDQLHDIPGATILDVGSYDGWLDFLLIGKGFKVRGVELIPALAESARSYALAHGLEYAVYEGFFDQLHLTGLTYQVGLCYEVLEHVPFEMVQTYVTNLETRATRRILISLPDQRHEDNNQHLWSPSIDIIKSLWGTRKDFKLTTQAYPGTDIPSNFFISWNL